MPPPWLMGSADSHEGGAHTDRRLRFVLRFAVGKSRSGSGVGMSVDPFATAVLTICWVPRCYSGRPCRQEEQDALWEEGSYSRHRRLIHERASRFTNFLTNRSEQTVAVVAGCWLSAGPPNLQSGWMHRMVVGGIVCFVCHLAIQRLVGWYAGIASMSSVLRSDVGDHRIYYRTGVSASHRWLRNSASPNISTT